MLLMPCGCGWWPYWLPAGRLWWWMTAQWAPVRPMSSRQGVPALVPARVPQAVYHWS